MVNPKEKFGFDMIIELTWFDKDIKKFFLRKSIFFRVFFRANASNFYFRCYVTDINSETRRWRGTWIIPSCTSLTRGKRERPHLLFIGLSQHNRNVIF